jgi:ABC-type sulfate transport system permease component
VDTVATFIFSEAQQGNGGAAMAISVISLAVSLAAVAALRFAERQAATRATDLVGDAIST